MPGAHPRTSTIALTDAKLPSIRLITAFDIGLETHTRGNLSDEDQHSGAVVVFDCGCAIEIVSEEIHMAKSWVIVADSARVRIFDADSRTGEFAEIEALVHPESRAHERELSSDRGGRSFDSVGDGRHGMTKHLSPHEHEAELFARRVAERLSEAHEAGEFKRFQLAAPPAFLGLLRKSLDYKLHDRMETVINKNLVQETPDSITEHFFGPRKQPRANREWARLARISITFSPNSCGCAPSYEPAAPPASAT